MGIAEGSIDADGALEDVGAREGPREAVGRKEGTAVTVGLEDGAEDGWRLMVGELVKGAFVGLWVSKESSKSKSRSGQMSVFKERRGCSGDQRGIAIRL